MRSSRPAVGLRLTSPRDRPAHPIRVRDRDRQEGDHPGVGRPDWCGARADAEYWLKLQDQYLLAEQAKNSTTQAKLDDVRRRSRLNKLAPIQVLQKRNILTGSTLDELEAEVMDLFGLASIESQPEFAAAAKRANHDQDISMLQQAWVACVRRQARKLPGRRNTRPKGSPNSSHRFRVR